MRAYRPLPSGISVEDEGEMLYSEAGCKSEGYPGCQHSLTMESKKGIQLWSELRTEISCQNHSQKPCCTKFQLFLVSVKSTIAKFC